MFVAPNKFLFMCLLLLDKTRGAGSSFLYKVRNSRPAYPYNGWKSFSLSSIPARFTVRNIPLVSELFKN